jgi:hypothetical protein
MPGQQILVAGIPVGMWSCNANSNGWLGPFPLRSSLTTSLTQYYRILWNARACNDSWQLFELPPSADFPFEPYPSQLQLMEKVAVRAHHMYQLLHIHWWDGRLSLNA